MNYQDFDYGTDTDSAPWTAAPSTQMLSTRGDAQLLPLTPNPLVSQTSAAPASSEMLVLGSFLASMQRAQSQQTYVLRELDARLARLENNTRVNSPAQPASFERATWWAIWGLLMLILGGALTVVIVLILMNLEFR